MLPTLLTEITIGTGPVTSVMPGTRTLICHTPGNCGESPENWTGLGGTVSPVAGAQLSTKQAPMPMRGVNGVETMSRGISPSAGGLGTSPWPVAKIEMYSPRATGLLGLLTD